MTHFKSTKTDFTIVFSLGFWVEVGWLKKTQTDFWRVCLHSLGF